jgi:hypothetical protein
MVVFRDGKVVEDRPSRIAGCGMTREAMKGRDAVAADSAVRRYKFTGPRPRVAARCERSRC